MIPKSLELRFNNYLNRMSRDLMEFNNEWDKTPSGFNEINTTPILKVKDNYIIPIPYLLYSTLPEAFYYDLIKNEEYRNNKGKIAEKEVYRLLRNVFPENEIHSNVEYGEKGKMKETDFLIIHEDKIIIIECTAKRTTGKTKRGETRSFFADLRTSIIRNLSM